MLMRRFAVLAMLCGGVVFGGATRAVAQDYPTKPIRFIVPYAAGGGGDAMARLVALPLSAALRQQVIVDNRPGAGGNIGAEIAARSMPDGYTIMLAAANLPMNLTLFEKVSFDPLRDFAPVTLLAATPNLVAVHPSVPAKSIKDLVALALANPGKLNYSSGGNGSTLHLAAELLKMMAGVNIVHVPYKGTGPAVVGLISGEVSMTIAPTFTLLPHRATGKARALAITSPERSSAVPDVPTVAESGLPGYEVTQWYGVIVPAGTPQQIVMLLNRECVKIVRAPEVSARLIAEASIPGGTTPESFGAYLKEEIAKWAKVVKLSGARVE
jgi:tripartite-type tricarboxylate transporter receptor subunit TctC